MASQKAMEKKVLTYRGITLSLAAWSFLTKTPVNAIDHRVRDGWDSVDAVEIKHRAPHKETTKRHDILALYDEYKDLLERVKPTGVRSPKRKSKFVLINDVNDVAASAASAATETSETLLNPTTAPAAASSGGVVNIQSMGFTVHEGHDPKDELHSKETIRFPNISVASGGNHITLTQVSVIPLESIEAANERWERLKQSYQYHPYPTYTSRL